MLRNRFRPNKIQFNQRTRKKRQATTRYEKAQSQARPLKKKIFVFSFLLTFSIIFAISLWFTQEEKFPIQAVKMVGELRYSDAEQLKITILPNIQKGFFAVNVSSVQEDLLQLPWIKQADVRRVWPGQLIVNISEHKPMAIWNETRLISSEGVLFELPREQIKQFSLPRLFGPEAKQMLVWEQYLKMEERISPLLLQISTLELAQRGAWQLQFNNGIRVKLGNQDVLVRLQRFVTVYQQALKNQADQIAYIDSRYTNGMAIGWASDTKNDK